MWPIGGLLLLLQAAAPSASPRRRRLTGRRSPSPPLESSSSIPSCGRVRDRLLAAIRDRRVDRVRALMAPIVADQDRRRAGRRGPRQLRAARPRHPARRRVARPRAGAGRRRRPARRRLRRCRSSRPMPGAGGRAPSGCSWPAATSRCAPNPMPPRTWCGACRTRWCRKPCGADARRRRRFGVPGLDARRRSRTPPGLDLHDRHASGQRPLLRVRPRRRRVEADADLLAARITAPAPAPNTVVHARDACRLRPLDLDSPSAGHSGRAHSAPPRRQDSMPACHFQRSEVLKLRTIMFSAVVLASPVRAIADPAPNAVIEWAGIVQQAIHGPAAPRSAGTSEILHTMVHLAVYDAVVAIEGGSRPFAAKITAAPNADVRAAVATAAYLTARPRIAAAHLATFDQAYSDVRREPAGGRCRHRRRPRRPAGGGRDAGAARQRRVHQRGALRVQRDADRRSASSCPTPDARPRRRRRSPST